MQPQVLAHCHLVKPDRAAQNAGDEGLEVDGVGDHSPPPMPGAGTGRSAIIFTAPVQAPGFAEDGGSVDDLGIGGPWVGGQGDLNGGDGSDPWSVVVGDPTHRHTGGPHPRGALMQLVEGDLGQLRLPGHPPGAVGAGGQQVGAPAVAGYLELGVPAGLADG